MRLKLYLLALTSFLISPTAYAEDVEWPTYYPSPYGAYRELHTTDRTAIGSQGGDVILALGGRVGINIANPVHVFEVRTTGGNIAAQQGVHTAGIVNTAGYGVAYGLAWDADTWGSVQAFQAGVAASAPLVLNPGGSTVAVGPGAQTGAHALSVGGDGRIGLVQNGQAGEFMVGAGTDNNYYAVYAPG